METPCISLSAPDIVSKQNFISCDFSYWASLLSIVFSRLIHVVEYIGTSILLLMNNVLLLGLDHTFLFMDWWRLRLFSFFTTMSNVCIFTYIFLLCMSLGHTQFHIVTLFLSYC